MTVTELRIFLEKMEKEGRGECKICVVSSPNCEPLDGLDKFVTNNIDPYYDDWDDTITITDNSYE